MKKFFSATLFLLLMMPLAARAFTNSGVEAEPLAFGQIIITDNTAVRSCTIVPGGTESCDAQITLLRAGGYGVFQLSDFDPTVAIWASVDDSATTLTGSGGQALDIKNFKFDPDIGTIGTAVTPNADGSLLIKIGATLKTRAGVSYNNTVYRGTFTLQINY